MRLLSWNVQWCQGLDGTVDPSRIAGEARRIAEPDVACFQEVSIGFHGDNQVDLLRREFPGYTFVFASAVDVPGAEGARRRFGNVIASRFPVGRVQRHALPWPKSDAPSMPRCALEAVIQAPFGALRVITTHLEYYSSAHRAAQIERLRELHAGTNRETSREKDEGPFQPQPRPMSAIVCGDFNMPPEDPLRARLLEGFFVDAWEHAHPGEPHPHTFHVHEEGKRPYCCDYVFLSKDLAPRLRTISIDGDNQASDHQPVFVELE